MYAPRPLKPGKAIRLVNLYAFKKFHPTIRTFLLVGTQILSNFQKSIILSMRNIEEKMKERIIV